MIISFLYKTILSQERNELLEKLLWNPDSAPVRKKLYDEMSFPNIQKRW